MYPSNILVSQERRLFYQTMKGFEAVASKIPPKTDLSEVMDVAKKLFVVGTGALTNIFFVKEVIKNNLENLPPNQTKKIQVIGKKISSLKEVSEMLGLVKQQLDVIKNNINDEERDLKARKMSRGIRLFKEKKLKERSSELNHLQDNVDFYEDLANVKVKKNIENLLDPNVKVNGDFFKNYLRFLAESNEMIQKSTPSIFRTLENEIKLIEGKMDPTQGRHISEVFLKCTLKVSREHHQKNIDFNEKLTNFEATDQKIDELENEIVLFASYMNTKKIFAELGDSIDHYFSTAIPTYNSYSFQAKRIKNSLYHLVNTTNNKAFVPIQFKQQKMLMDRYNQILINAFETKVSADCLKEIEQILSGPQGTFHYQVQNILSLLTPNIIKLEEKGSNALDTMKKRLLTSYSERLNKMSVEYLTQNKNQIMKEQRRALVDSFAKSIRYIIMLRDIELYLVTGKVNCNREQADHLLPEALTNLLRFEGLEELIEEKINHKDVHVESAETEEKFHELSEDTGNALPKFHYSISNEQEDLKEELVAQKILPESTLITTRFKFGSNKVSVVKSKIVKAGFILEKKKDGKGSHSIYRKGICMITLPEYKDRRIPKGTLGSIERVVEKSQIK